MKLVYSPEAVADLVRLREVARIAAELVTRIGNLCDFPHMGQSVAQASPPAVVRDMVFGNYVVRYSVHTEVLVVLRLWHQKEDHQ